RSQIAIKKCGIGVSWSAFKDREGFFIPAPINVDDTQAKPRQGIAWIDLQCLFNLRPAFNEQADVKVDHAQFMMRIIQLRIQSYRALVGLNRLLVRETSGGRPQDEAAGI